MRNRSPYPSDDRAVCLHLLFALATALIPILVAAIVLVSPTEVKAQTLYASIVGTVSDPSGRAIPDAVVKATQTETLESRITVTNDSGVYTLSTVPAAWHVRGIYFKDRIRFIRSSGNRSNHQARPFALTRS